MSVHWAALLRAINVGGRTVTMDRLRTHFGELGFTGVATLIASGNVTFHSRSAAAATLERRIERHLEAALGLEVATFLRTLPQLEAVAGHQPFDPPARDGDRLSVAFLKAKPPEVACRRLLSLRNPVDDFAVLGREVWWLRRGQHGDSTFSGNALERVLGMPATMRNITTVRRLIGRLANEGV